MRAAFPALLLTAVTVFAQSPQFDLIITNAKIIDGTGAPWFLSDIGVRGDTITAIGSLSTSSTTTRIDAGGLTVAPRFH